MTPNQEFRSLLQKLQCANHYAQSIALKDIAARIQEAGRNELLALLEFLILTHDMEIQVKLFSILAAYLLSNGVDYEPIVKYNPLYESIQNLLVRGLPLKAAPALNFVLALLSCDEGNSSLVTHARNMLRVSGCLSSMSEMFASGMMYQDTWVALCQCLAEACRGSDVNQSHCSHLVPLSVQRCCQGNVDVCPVLQSLLHNNDRNIRLFLDCNGLNIFTRQLLQYSMCMQLLNTIVEKSSYAVSVLKNTDIVYHLRDFLRLYGPYSQMGQWATIILYHLDTRSKSHNNVTNKLTHIPEIPTSTEHGNQNHRSRPNNMVLNHNFQNSISEVAGDIAVEPRSKSVSNITITRIVNPANNVSQRPDLGVIDDDDTIHLFQNVIKEVIYWKTKNMDNFKRPQTVTPITPFNGANIRRVKNIPVVKNLQPCHMKERNINHNTSEKELSFSFLLNNSKEKHTEVNIGNNVIDTLGSNSKIPFDITSQDKGVQTETSIFQSTGNYNEQTVLDMEHFRPPFISTPKQNKTNKVNVSKRTTLSKISLNKNNKMPASKSNKPKQRKKSPNKEVKKRSMSARLFSAINESCTTIVKSMKSIFRPKHGEVKQDKDNTLYDHERIEGNGSCSYSFTNYMRQRDAILQGERTNNDDASSASYRVNSCKTCKDTIILQNKMASDDQLKQTVKRLKLGINLYGCDFKKISKGMWPRDRYMTPEILYNLYRKLIAKGGHDNHEFRLKAHNIIKRK